MIRSLALLLVAALAGCSGSATKLSSGFGTPATVVAYSGVTSRRPELQTYLAVASSRGGELRIVDPREDRPLLGPTLVFPLSVPTDARPLWLASGSLGDGGADLLVVGSAGEFGGPSIQLVDTWTAVTRVVDRVALVDAGAPQGSQLLSLAAEPLPGQPGRGRLAVGLGTPTGGVLALFEVARQADGSVALQGAPVIRPLGFDPVELAFAPHDPAGAPPPADLLFIATTDPIPTSAGAVKGVAQLSLADGSVTALDALDGTEHVTVAWVAERTFRTADDADAVDVLSPARELRVYAVLDRAGCGDTAPIRCGVATLIPGVGLAPDPARQVELLAARDPDSTQPYRAPFETVGVAMAIGAAPPQARLPDDWACRPSDPSSPLTVALAPPGPGVRCTSAVGVVASSDGNVYVADLARFQVPSTSVPMSSSVGARVTSAAATVPLGATGGRITLASDEGALVSEAAKLPAQVGLTPGFTPDDAFTITWQGLLPDLVAVRGVVQRLADGRVVVAAQRPVGASTWTVGARVSSPVLGIRQGDIVQIVTDDPGPCEGDVAGARIASETTIEVAPLAPDPVAYPGGALQIPDGCWASGLVAGGTPRPVSFNVRAQGLVLAGSVLGYLGRPELWVKTADAAVPPRFALRYSAAADVPGGDPVAAHALEPVSTEQAIARKLRRRFYAADLSCAKLASVGTSCAAFGASFAYAFAPGPALTFRVAATEAPVRDATVSFGTASGYTGFVARPSNAVLPVGVAAVDRSVIPGGEKLGYRWYVAYSDDQLFVFGPAETPNQYFSIR